MGLIPSAQFSDLRAMESDADFYAPISDRKEYRLFPDNASDVSNSSMQVTYRHVTCYKVLPRPLSGGRIRRTVRRTVRCCFRLNTSGGHTTDIHRTHRRTPNTTSDRPPDDPVGGPATNPLCRQQIYSLSVERGFKLHSF
jgi:hypothetical protein